MSLLRLIFLGLAIWGAVHPMSFFGPYILEHGVEVSTLEGLVAAWKANELVSGLYWDLVISAIALTVWILAEVSVRRNWLSLIAIPATFLIGVSCGLPLYLFLRSRPLR